MDAIIYGLGYKKISYRVTTFRRVLELSFLVARYVFFPPSAARVQAYERAPRRAATSRWGRHNLT